MGYEHDPFAMPGRRKLLQAWYMAFFFFFIMQPTLTFSSKAWFARAPLFLLACHNQPCIQLVEVFCYLDYSLVKGPQPLLNLI